MLSQFPRSPPRAFPDGDDDGDDNGRVDGEDGGEDGGEVDEVDKRPLWSCYDRQTDRQTENSCQSCSEARVCIRCESASWTR